MSSPSVTLRSLRIFVVENHADTLRYFKMYLESFGHKVFQARTMAQALAEVPQAQCDVLISDLGLPDGSGWELMRKLEEDGGPSPRYAIAISGYGSSSDREKSRNAGFRHHLLKPFNPDELDRLLDEAARELVSGASR